MEPIVQIPKQDVDSPLTQLENDILNLLNNRPGIADPVIDLPELQELCLNKGFSIAEFSHAFVLLLTRRLIEPRGEFRYALSSKGCKQNCSHLLTVSFV